MKPAFKKDGGTVTAGNASGINDSAAAVVLAGGRPRGPLGLKPLARLVGYAHAAWTLPMGIGPARHAEGTATHRPERVQDYGCDRS